MRKILDREMRSLVTGNVPNVEGLIFVHPLNGYKLVRNLKLKYRSEMESTHNKLVCFYCS
jgi:hypothetical protein